MTVQEYAARANERQAQALLAAARATPDNHHAWKPLESGRTVIDQVAECALINRVAIKVLHERAWDTAGDAEFGTAHAALDTLEKAGAALEENTAALAAAIRAVPDEQLELEIILPWTKTTVADTLLLPYWNMAYHEGQINYIQTLGKEKDA